MRKTPPNWVVAILALLLFAALRLPVLSQFYDYHSDEHYYTDGALQMLKTGDWLTPRYANGEMNVAKPPPTYWTVAGSFSLLGISPLTSRIPFFAVGCLILLLAWHFARRVFGGDDDAALMTVAVLASNANFFYHIGYAITDCLLSFWILSAHYGFYRALVEDDKRRRWMVLGYFATGMALATKGIPGGLALAAAGVYALWRWQSGAGWSAVLRLLSVPAIVCGIAAAAAWPVAESLQNGRAFWAMFYDDQVGMRLQSHNPMLGVLSNAATNLAYYPAVLTEYFAPWSILALFMLVCYRKEVAAACSAAKPRSMYVAVALLTTLLIYLPPNIHRTRYFMPLYPFLAMAMVAVFRVASERTRVERWWPRLAVLFCGAGIGGSIWLLAKHGVQHTETLPYAIAVSAAIVAAIFFISPTQRMLLAGLSVVLVFSIFDWSVAPECAACPSPRVYERLNERGYSSGPVGVGPWVMYELAPQLRLLSGGKLEFQNIAAHDYYRVCLVREDKKEPAVPPGVEYEFAGKGVNLEKEKQGDFLRGRNNDRMAWIHAWLTGKLDQFINRRRDNYLLEWNDTGAPFTHTQTATAHELAPAPEEP